MAIDLNKPIGQAASQAAALPSKKSINLLVRERKTAGVGKYVLIALLLLALVAAFAKFAVLDVFEQVNLKNTELFAAQSEYESVQKQLEGYDAVLEEYHSYTGVDTADQIDALQVMNLVGTVVQPRANVVAASSSDGKLVVNVKDITLDELGQLADALRAQDLVSDVVVMNAVEARAGQSGAAGSSAQEAAEPGAGDKEVSATLQIQLAVAQEEGGE